MLVAGMGMVPHRRHWLVAFDDLRALVFWARRRHSSRHSTRLDSPRTGRSPDNLCLLGSFIEGAPVASALSHPPPSAFTVAGSMGRMTAPRL